MGKISCLPPGDEFVPGQVGHIGWPVTVSCQSAARVVRRPRAVVCSQGKRTDPTRPNPQASLPPWKPFCTGSLTTWLLQEWHLAKHEQSRVDRSHPPVPQGSDEARESISNLFSKALSVVNRCVVLGRASGAARTRLGQQRIERYSLQLVPCRLRGVDVEWKHCGGSRRSPSVFVGDGFFESPVGERVG